MQFLLKCSRGFLSGTWKRMRTSSNLVVRICLKMLKMIIFLVLVRRGHFIVLCVSLIITLPSRIWHVSIKIE